LEEYVSDCVILLDNRVVEQVSTRRLRIIKYRGTMHGTNEYPFLIDHQGISVLPVTSLELNYSASRNIISSGIPELDQMLGNGGYFEGSSILVSGFSGTGKSSIAASFANKTCQEGKKCLFFAFEESPDQILRNMKSVNLDLAAHCDKKLLQIRSVSPTVYGLEMHLVAMHKAVAGFKPDVVIVDPITNLRTVANCREVKAMLTRLIFFLKSEGITAMFTSEIKTSDDVDPEDESISSLCDTWLMVRDIEANGERNRGLFVMKSRGMHHTNKVREFIISNDGIHLVPVATDKNGNVLVGSAREAAGKSENGINKPGAKTVNQ
ncbi:MAG: circadian clock protein KaiC, partial [Sphingobacteriales bacterium]